MALWLRRLLTVACAGLAWAGLTLPARACPFCGPQQPTLIGDYNQASMVLFGQFTNPKADPEDFSGGTTDFKIQAVLKSNDLVKGKKVITVQRYVPQDRTKYLIFCDVYKGKVDPFRGVAVEGKGDVVSYLE